LTTVVLLVLAGIWGLLLFMWLRSRTDGTFGDSVGSFRHHLHVLERTAPVTMRPANRLRTGTIAGRPSMPAYGRDSTMGMRSAGMLRPPSAAAMRRRQSQRRRRNILAFLGAVTLLSLLVAVMTGSHDAMAFQVLCDLLLAGYVGLLVHMRNLAAERELKLAYLPTGSRLAEPRPARRRQAAAAYGGTSYELAPGYGELALRRVASR